MKTLTVFAMGEKGHAVLSLLFERYPGLVSAVVTATDSAVSDDFHDEIISLCARYAVPACDRSDAPAAQTDFALAVSWRWLIEDSDTRLIVLHDSLLPRYRGFNPLVTALIAGDCEIGVTALYGVDEYDRGPMISQSSSRIEYPVRIADAIQTILGNYRELAGQIGDDLSQGLEPAAVAQTEGQATYSLWRDDEDYRIDWSLSAAAIRRMIDATGEPYRGASSMLDGRLTRVLRVREREDVAVANRTPGKVIFVESGTPVVVCGEGLLAIDEAVDDATGESVLPLARFRMRFS